MDDFGLNRMQFPAFRSVNDDQFDPGSRFRSGGAATVLIGVPHPLFACSSIVDTGWNFVSMAHSSPSVE